LRLGGFILESWQFGEEKFLRKMEGRAMANTMPIPNLPTISAQEIHANNLRAFRIGNQARYELNQGLRALHGNGLLKDLEYSSITEYAEAHFGFGRSQTINLQPLCKGCHALKTLGLLIVRQKEDGTLAFERKSDQLTASILREAEKELSAMPRVVAAVSTRVDGGNGLSNTVSTAQAQRALRTLGRIGLREEDARRRLNGAIKEFQESGKSPSDHDLVQEALLKMEDGSK
jgi:hypothetical protein